MTKEEKIALALEIIDAAERGDNAKVASTLAGLFAASNPEHAVGAILLERAITKVLDRSAGEGGILQRFVSRVFGWL